MGYVGNNSLSKIGSWVKTKLKAWYIAYDNRASGLLSNAVQYAIDEVLGKVWETERNIAPMEYSPAESSHAVGEYITYNDHLYKVISAISIGQTLQIGTNIQQVSMGNEITDLKSDITDTISTTFENIESLGTIGQNSVQKYGNVAVCVLNSWGSKTFTNNQRFAHIPDSITPKFATNYGVCGYNIGGTNYLAPITVTNGDVIVPAPGTYTNIYLVITIPCEL